MSERMGHHMRVNPDTSAGTIRRTRFAWVLLVGFLAVLVLIPATRALEPAWNYSVPGAEIGGVAVSPKGDLIAVGAGKVHFFTRDGTLLAKEAYGNDVRMTSDGNYTASVDFATVYYFKNPQPGGSPDQQKVTKVWDKELSEQVSSFDMNRDGSLIAGQTLRKNLFVLNTKTMLARSNIKAIDPVIKISGGGIVGVSAGKLHTYNTGGNLTRTFNLTTISAPGFLVSTGSIAVFSDGGTIHWINNIYDGKERWKRQVSGSVTALSITPGGSLIIAGTDKGSIARVNADGNFSWNYSSNPEDRPGTWITCVAVSDKGTMIAAGTADGKILFLDSRGGLTGSYNAHEYIRHIAMSADGSVVVATSDERVYAFSPGSFPKITAAPSRTATPEKNISLASPVQTPVITTTASVAPPQAPTTTTPTVLPATYSFIRAATQSPPSSSTLVCSLVLAFLLLGKRQKT